MQEDVEAIVTFLLPSYGGRMNAVTSGYRPQFHYAGAEWDAEHTYPDVEEVAPGQTARAILRFTNPAAHWGKLKPGSPFLLREGRQIIGYGAITKILGLEESAKRASAE